MALIDLQIAARSLAQHRKRSLFLGGAIAIVTVFLVLLVSLTEGIQETILKTGTTLMTGHVNVGGFYKITATTPAPLVVDADKVLQAVLPEVPELEYAVGRGRGYAKAVSETASMDLVLGGLLLDQDRRFTEAVMLAEGNLADLAKPNTIMLFQTEVKRLGVKVGDTLTLSAPTYRGMANTADVRVAAIAKDMGVMSYFNAFMPYQTLERLYQLKPGATGAFHLYLKDYRDSEVVAQRLRDVLAKKGWRVMDAAPQPYWIKLMLKVGKEDWTGQKLDITTWADEMSQMNWIITVLQALTGFLLFLLGLIIFAGVMSTMWIAIRERTREIGTLRAIGMHRRRVLLMFLTESLLLGLLGAAAGGVIGSALVLIVNAVHVALPQGVQWLLMADKLHLSLNVAKVAVIGGLLTLLTCFSALFPSIRAARLKPVTAMHHLG